MIATATSLARGAVAPALVTNNQSCCCTCPSFTLEEGTLSESKVIDPTKPTLTIRNIAVINIYAIDGDTAFFIQGQRVSQDAFHFNDRVMAVVFDTNYAVCLEKEEPAELKLGEHRKEFPFDKRDCGAYVINLCGGAANIAAPTGSCLCGSLCGYGARHYNDTWRPSPRP